MTKSFTVKELQKYLVNGAVIAITFRACGAILSFFCIVTISRFYGTDLLGVYVTIATVSTLLSIFVKVGQDIYLTKHLPICEVNGLSGSQLIKDSIIVVSLAAILILTTVSLLTTYFPLKKYFQSDHIQLIYTLAIAAPSIALLQVFAGAFRGLHFDKLYLLFSTVSLHLTLLVMVVSAKYVSYDIKIWELYIFSSISNAAMAGIALYFCFPAKLINKKFKRGSILQRILELINNASPLMISSSAIAIFGYTDIILLNVFTDSKSVGLYAGLNKINTLVGLVAIAVSNLIPALISESYHKKEFSSVTLIYNRAQRICWIVGGFILLLCLTFRDSYLNLLGPEFFIMKTEYFLVCFLGAITVLFGPQISILNMIGEQKFVQFYSVLGLVLNVGLNIFLIPQFGILGALIATGISTVVWKIAVFIRLHSKIMEWKNQ